MNVFPDKASLENPWWINSVQQEVTPFDYSLSRLDGAKKHINTNNLTINNYLNDIKQSQSDDFTLLFKIASLLQDTLIHNPVFQPSEEKRPSLKSSIRSILHSKPIQKYQLINDPLLLLTLGEARCGQVAQILVSLLHDVNIKSNVEKLNHHIVTNVILNGQEYLIDADAFKNGVFFFKDKKTLFTRKEILNNPNIIDQFKHTGWMFRKNTRYGINKNNQPFSGYVDFFMPENDGLISRKFGNNDSYCPPGIPIWNHPTDTIYLKINETLPISFNGVHVERADYYLARVCKKGKGYSYNNLIYKNLLNESANVEEETKLKKQEFVFSRTSSGEYYITVCAMSRYLEQNNCYVWWSDEIRVIVEE